MDGDADWPSSFAASLLLLLSSCSSMAAVSTRLSLMLIVPWISRIARPDGVCSSGGKGLLGRVLVEVPLSLEERRFGGFAGFGGWRGIDGMVVMLTAVKQNDGMYLRDATGPDEVGNQGRVLRPVLYSVLRLTS